jgi:hypothetical protein
MLANLKASIQTNYLETKVTLKMFQVKHQDQFVFSIDTKYVIAMGKMETAPKGWTI